MAAQTDDAYMRALSSYEYDYSRFIKILGVRLNNPSNDDCFYSVYDGITLAEGIETPPPSVDNSLS